jgi:hypothetical protein
MLAKVIPAFLARAATGYGKVTLIRDVARRRQDKDSLWEPSFRCTIW